MPPRKSRSTLTTAARQSQCKAHSSAKISAAASEAAVPPPKLTVRPHPCPCPCPCPSPNSHLPPLFLPEPIVDEERDVGTNASGPKLGGEVDELDEWDTRVVNVETLELLDGEVEDNTPVCNESEPEVIEASDLPESEPELLPASQSLSSSSPDSSPILFLIDQQVKPASKVIKKEPKTKSKPTVPKTRQGKKASKPVSDIEDEIDDSDLVVPKLLVCFVQAEGGLKQHEIDMEIDFEIFQYHISNILKVPTWELALTYSFCTMKQGNRCFVSDKGEFASMIREARNFYNQQISTIRGEQLKDAVVVHNARNCGHIGVRKPTKQIPRLNLTIYNKTLTNEKGAKGKAKDMPSEVKIESLSGCTLHICSELEKKDCSECRQPCVLVPNADGKPVHKPLNDSHLDLWADHVARGLCTTQRPPPALVLSLTDAQPCTHNCNTTDRDHSAHSTGMMPNSSYLPVSLSGLLVPPQYPPYPHALGPMPLLHGYPPMFYPPTYNAHPTYHSNAPYSTPFGMHPNPYVHNYTPFPYGYQDLSFATSNATPTRPRAASPWLSDWLLRLDAGERANFGDNFGSLASGFAAAGILELAHLHNFTEDDIQQIAFPTPFGSVVYISLATASWLVQYVYKDLSACNFI